MTWNNTVYLLIVGMAVATVFVACQNSGGGQNESEVDVFADHVRSTEAVEAMEAKKRFRLPDGFEIELFASEPQIGKPMNMAFDARGRLWVSQTTAYPFPAGPGKGKDRITILEDTDGDGRADVFTDVADTLNIPIGILPYRDGVISFSIPNIYYFPELRTQGTDSTKVLVGAFGYKDTHGMINGLTRGFDGWIYACHGFSNESDAKGTDGSRLVLSSGNTFRFQVDGSRLQQTTSGRVNPFGLAFDERGYLYSVDCHSSPLYQLITGGEYPHFGKMEGGIGYAPEMKPHDQEATALAGIAYYADDRFPEAYCNNFYVGDVVKSRIYRYAVDWCGSSPVGRQEDDFLTTDDPWFRPVDVQMGHDGALYVADFYNRIIGHYEVPLDHPGRDRERGRIWKITYKGPGVAAQGKESRTDWSSASIKELLQGLKRNNLKERMLITDRLSDYFGLQAVAAIEALLQSGNADAYQCVHGLWILHRLGALRDERIRKASKDGNPLIRLHTMRIIKELGQRQGYFQEEIRVGLKDEDVHVRRAAAEALAAMGGDDAFAQLLEFIPSIPDEDTHLNYTAYLGLCNVLKNEELLREVAKRGWTTPEKRILTKAMVGVEHALSSVFLASCIYTGELDTNELIRVVPHAFRFLPEPSIRKLVDALVRYTSDGIVDDQRMYYAMEAGFVRRGTSGHPYLKAWAQQLATEIFEQQKAGSKAADDLLHFASYLVGQHRLIGLEDKLLAYFCETKKRRQKLAAGKSLLMLSESHYAPLVVSTITADSIPLETKRRMMSVLAGFPNAPIRNALARLDHIPPELQRDVIAILAASSEGKDIVLEKIRKGEWFARTLAGPGVEEGFLMNSTAKQRRLYQELVANLEPVSEEKDRLISERLAAFSPSADLKETGKALFAKHCSACHRIGNEGGIIGPQLTGIGNWGADALAEKILDPNRNISEAFRTYTVRTKGGTQHTALFRRDDGDAKVFANVAGEEFTIRKADIALQEPSKFTLMPDQFGTALTQAEFNALLTYLVEEK